MRNDVVIMAIGAIAIAALIAGCTGHENVTSPADLFNTSQISWYEYNLTQYYYPGNGAVLTINVEQIRVGSVDETWDGTPAKHKIVTLTRGHFQNYYDVYVDGRGRILAGNLTKPNDYVTPLSEVARGNDYVGLLGSSDIAASLGAEKNIRPTFAGYETISSFGMSYNCTLYNLTMQDGNYTIWHNQSLPLPPKIAAYPAGGLRIYQLTGYGSNPGEALSTPTPMPSLTPHIPLPIAPIAKLGPSILFNMDNISWYRYVVAVPMNDTVRHQKMRVEYGVYTRTSGDGMEGKVEELVNSTSIEHNWYADGYLNSVSISENESGVLGGGSRGSNLNTGRSYGNGLDAEWAREIKQREDLSMWFNAETDRTMKPEGYENVRYNGDLYNCTVYSVSNDTYRVWKNASVPLPLKIVLDTHDYPIPFGGFPGGYQEIGPSTFELLDWG